MQRRDPTRGLDWVLLDFEENVNLGGFLTQDLVTVEDLIEEQEQDQHAEDFKGQ